MGGVMGAGPRDMRTFEVQAEDAVIGAARGGDEVDDPFGVIGLSEISVGRIAPVPRR
jgi:hypothetical protein